MYILKILQNFIHDDIIGVVLDYLYGDKKYYQRLHIKTLNYLFSFNGSDTCNSVYDVLFKLNNSLDKDY